MEREYEMKSRNMSKLDKSRTILKLLDELGLEPSLEQKDAFEKIENEYVLQEIIPLLKEDITPLVERLRNSFSLRISKKGNDLVMEKRRVGGDVPEASSSSSVEKRCLIRVTFPDGRVICHPVVTETFVEVVKYAGAKRVHELKIMMFGENIISDHLMDNTRYRSSQKYVGDGLYVNAYSSTDRKFEQLVSINIRLMLKLRIERVLVET